MTRENNNTGRDSANANDGVKRQVQAQNQDAIAMGSLGCHAEFFSDSDELIGEALKSVYRQTVDEALPNEFQDLLDKLN